ncbi:MAG: Gldg family protein [Planctomycetota bacterium]|jgi:ABC-type uncharacterized transport system involved in gliding motility auxiliary subunit
MSRTIKVILAVIFVLAIMFSAISISQNIGTSFRADITERKLYTLSEGSKTIVSKLNQPLTMKMYYTQTAARKGPDQIQFFNNYYHYIESLLAQYVAASNGMVQFQNIDPRPFTDDESDAIRYGLTGIPISEEEKFYFGLVVQTQFGVIKTIPFFSPQRQQFVEYDISSLIDNAIRRQKRTVGILSSLPVMGEHSEYMAQMMMMQGKRPRQPWTIVSQLQDKYDVQKVETDIDKIENVDLLLVIHPKSLPQNTLFAIDQYVLNGGRTIVCLDPHCMLDQPEQMQMQMMQQPHSTSSNLEPLMKQWGLSMPANTYAGDLNLALLGSTGAMQRPVKFISALGLNTQCFNPDSVMTSELNSIRMRYTGALQATAIPDNNAVQIKRIPLVTTTESGNTFEVGNEFELRNPQLLLQRFVPGVQPVTLASMATGKFKSAYPNGIEIKSETDPNAPPKKLTGITQAAQDCAVVVLADVDFITDNMAYQNFLTAKIAIGDNAALLLNIVDQLGGSSELVSIRSRGSFQRSFDVVNQIEADAQKSTEIQKTAINQQLVGFQQELQKLLTSSGEQQEIIGSTIMQKKKDLELQIRNAQKSLQELKRQERVQIEQLGASCRNFNTLPGPVLVLLIAVILAVYRAFKKRYYVSHATD